MGNFQSQSKLGYDELRSSIPGTMLVDQDFDLFYSLCKIETIGGISTVLHPSPSQLFYVVISGQVVVHLSSPKVPNVCATTFSSGDMIHFFNSPVKPVTQLDNSCLINGNVKLSLHFKGYTEKMGRVIGMDRKGWDTFMRVRAEHKKPLASLLSITVVEYIKNSSYLEALTAKQVQMLGPLLKIRLVAKGNPIIFPSKLNAGLARNFTCAGSVAVVLSGSCLSIPIAQDVGALADKLLKESPHSSSMRSVQKPPLSIMNSLSKIIGRTPRSNAHRSPSQNVRRQSHGGDSTSMRSNQSGMVSLSLSDSSKVNTSQALGAGSILGLDAFLLRDPVVPMKKYLATSSLCIVGYIYPKLLDALCQVDPRLQRVLSRNYHRVLLDSVRSTVPMLSGMDDVSFAKLSGKVALKAFAAGNVIYERDQTSDLAYIVLAGAVSLTSLLSQERGADEVAERLDQVLTWGHMFGDMALVSSSPYFNTTTAVEPTVTIAISKRTLDEIYFDNKAKLCEIRIKLVGTEVDILHVIDHPHGSELFKAFLAKVVAVENLEFYHAVDRFDSMCTTVGKLYFEIKKLRSRLDMDALTNNIDPQSLANGSVNQENKVNEALTSIAEAGPKVPKCSHIAHTTTITTMSSAAVVDPYEADAQLNSAYMAKLFAEFDANDANTPSPGNQASYQTDDEGDDDTVGASATGAARAPFAHLYAVEPSDSNSVRSAMSDDEGDAFPKFSIKVKPQSEKHEKPMEPDPPSTADSPFSNLNLTVTTAPSDTPKTRMTKSTILREKLSMFHPKQDSRTHPSEEQQIEGLIQSGASVYNTAGGMDKSALTREQNIQLYNKIQRRLDKLRHGIVELREVAKNIIETFVFEGAPNQVNLSSKTRNRMEKTFREWSVSGYGSNTTLSPLRNSSPKHGESNITTSAVTEEESLLASSLRNSPMVAMFPDNVNVNFSTLFEEAKNEVLKLLRHDNFPRWKRTPEFLAFVDSVKRKDHNMTSGKMEDSVTFDHSAMVPGLSSAHRSEANFDSQSNSERVGFPSVAVEGGGGANQTLFAALSNKLTSSKKTPENGNTPLDSPPRRASAGQIFGTK